MKKILIFLLCLALSAIFIVPAFAQEADEWSQYQKNKGNTGYLNISLPVDNTVGHETAAIDARDGSQPIVSGKYAYIYAGVQDTTGSLICYDLSVKTKVWEENIKPFTAMGSWSSPAVSEGTAYIGSADTVYAFDSLTGTPKWSKSLGAGADIVNSSPTIDGSRLFIGDWANGKYLCLDTMNGDIIWEQALDADCNAQSTAAVDGNMVFVGQMSAVFGDPNGKVWCLNKADGQPVTSWGTNGYFETDGKADVTGSVAVSGDYIYFTDFSFGVSATPNSYLYCLDKSTGKEQWKVATWPSSGTPAVGEGAVVTAGNQWATFPDPSTNWTSAYTEEAGSKATTNLWTVQDIGGWTMSPCIGNGKVSVGIFDSGTFTNSAGVTVRDLSDGSEVWTSASGGSAPVPTNYGLLSIDGSTGTMVVFGSSSPLGLASTYYSAEGTTRTGYQEWICLENPINGEINANIEYMTSTGETKDQGLLLPANSRTTVDANSYMGPGNDISGLITGNGHFVAERAMYVNTNGISGGEQVMCKTSGELNHLFAEGCTRNGYQTWLAIQNPGESDAQAIITYFYSNKDAKAENITLPAKTRTTINVNESAGPEEDVSIALASDKPTVAERVMYFNVPGGVSGVHNSTGTDRGSQNWYFAEGTTRGNFQEWLCLMNPSGQEASATVSYMTLDGEVINKEKILPPNSRTTINVNTDIGFETDLSLNVTSNRNIVAERPMYFSYTPQGIAGQVWTGGHNTIGAKYAAYKWELAEGTTRNGFQTYLCISNPNSTDVDVSIDFITNSDGTNETVTDTITVPANTRHTVMVSDVIGFEKDVSFTVTAPIPVIVERPMYFNSNGFIGGGVSLGLPGSL